MNVKDKFQAIVKKRKTAACERKISEEIENDVDKHFNNKGSSRNSQQSIGMSGLFRELVAK